MKVGRLITLYTAVMSLGKLVKRLNLLFRVVVVKSTSLRSRRLKGKVGGGGGGGRLKMKKQPTRHPSGFPAKFRPRNERRNFILMVTCHYPDPLLIG